MSCNKWLKDYKNLIFVETGSGTGGGIASAWDNGFKEIHSIEIDEQRYKMCCIRFEGMKDIHLYHGKSVDHLPKILAKLTQQATFTLDAHIMDFTKETYDPKLVCPVLEELELICEHSNMNKFNHSVLIDDVRYLDGNTETFSNLTVDDIREQVLEAKLPHTITIHRKFIYVNLQPSNVY